MINFLIRRLWQSLLTVAGVMLLTFILFRQIAGDVSASFVNQKLGREARQAFYEKHKLDRPAVFNIHRRFVLENTGPGVYPVGLADSGSSSLAKLLDLRLALPDTVSLAVRTTGPLLYALSPQSSLSKLTGGAPWIVTSKTGATEPAFLILSTRSGERISVPVDTITSVGGLLSTLSAAGAPHGVTASLTRWSPGSLFDSQFFWHLRENLTFCGRSYATDQSLFEIIAERGKFSLALTLPMLSIGWILALAISCLVAYYRNGLIDKLGVLLSVLGMCIPYLAYMLIGQWILFKLAPSLAAGLSHPAAIFVPVLIAVVAGLGGSVRFYRTIILDQVNQDYVRTARAKGVGLSSILFKHVLRNSMLPILTNLVTTIPFLIMGSLLLERFFGIPGLGDLMLTSIYSRDVPIITGLTFLTAILYVASLLATDLLYAVFDPRVRLQ